jgi:mRNA-degrading endonuclease toxin of MazEF toxin-antitoxin module
MSAWNEKHSKYPWRLMLVPTTMNGLEKDVAVQPEQMRCLSIERFVEPKGTLSADEYSEVKSALALILGIE